MRRDTIQIRPDCLPAAVAVAAAVGGRRKQASKQAAQPSRPRACPPVWPASGRRALIDPTHFARRLPSPAPTGPSALPATGSHSTPLAKRQPLTAPQSHHTTPSAGCPAPRRQNNNLLASLLPFSPLLPLLCLCHPPDQAETITIRRTTDSTRTAQHRASRVRLSEVLGNSPAAADCETAAARLVKSDPFHPIHRLIDCGHLICCTCPALPCTCLHSPCGVASPRRRCYEVPSLPASGCPAADAATFSGYPPGRACTCVH